MAHQFSIKFELSGVSLQDAKRLLGDPGLHESVARKIPGTKLSILDSRKSGRRYVMKREYNLDVDLHDLTKKLLKDAFRLKREDDWDIETLCCQTRFSMNLPADLSCRTTIQEKGEQLMVSIDWEVNVRIPLIHQMLAKHAEGEIRRFNQKELEVIQEEIDAQLAA